MPPENRCFADIDDMEKVDKLPAGKARDALRKKAGDHESAAQRRLAGEAFYSTSHQMAAFGAPSIPRLAQPDMRDVVASSPRVSSNVAVDSPDIADNPPLGLGLLLPNVRDSGVRSIGANSK